MILKRSLEEALTRMSWGGMSHRDDMESIKLDMKLFDFWIYIVLSKIGVAYLRV